MIRTFLLLVCLLTLKITNGFSQISESVPIPYTKNSNLKPLGASEEYAFFYATELHKELIRITIYKFKTSSLELVESKDFVMKDFRPNFFNNNSGTCKIEGTYKNNRFFFFYSMVEERDYHIFMKVVDESFGNERTVELGTIVETGYDILGNFFVSYSPDDKLALLSLKNFCEQKKAVGYNSEIFEDTEFIVYDMVNDKVLYSKRIPVEIDGLRQKTQRYKLDNDGNITFISSLTERTDRFSVRSISIGYSTSEKDQIAFSKVNLEGIPSFSQGFYQLKNNDFILTIISKNTIRVKYVSLKNPSRNYEKELNSSCLKDQKEDFQIEELIETEDGFYLLFREGGSMNYTGYISYAEDRYLPVAFFDKEGEYKWSKALPVIKPLYHRYYGRPGVHAVFSNNKLHAFYVENKPYEINEKTQKILDENRTMSVNDYRKYNTIEATVEANQTITKRAVEENPDFFADPKAESMLLHEGALYFVSNSKKAFKIKKVILN